MSFSSASSLLANSSSFLSNPLFLLLSQKEVISFFDSNQIECRILSSHPCMIKNLLGLRNESQFRVSIESLEQLFISYNQSISDASETQGYFDPIDIIEYVLVNMHCYAVNQKCYESEEIKLSDCNSPCLLHQYFHLMVSENQTCQCGESWKNDWESSTICQYFHINSIFLDFDQSKSSNLLYMPEFSLNSPKFQFNSPIFKSKIIRCLIDKMNSATADYCENDSCQYKNTSVSFELKKSPTWYFIDLIYESHNKSYLESYLSTTSIDQSIELKAIYKHGLNQKYQLEAVFFHDGKNRAKLAQLKGKFWTFNRLQGLASWEQVVHEALVMNFHPVALAYKAGASIEKVLIDDLKLVKMEQIAVQCDAYREKFARDVLDDDEGLAERQYLAVEGSLGFGEGQKFELKKDEPGLISAGLSVWRCECGEKILNDFDVCVSCHRVKPGVKGWVCDQCTFKNDDYLSRCSGCHEYRKQDFDRLENERNDSSWSSWSRKRGNFDSDYTHQVEEVKANKESNPTNVNWICKCNQINQNDFEVCLGCSSLKPGLSGWVCKVCKVRNSEYSYRCSACETLKGDETSDQEFWLCEGCNSANTFKSRTCGKCYKYRSEFGFDRDRLCHKCYQKFDKMLDECPNCKVLPVNDALKLLNKCEKCKIKDIYVAGRCIDCQYSRQFEPSKPAEIPETKVESLWECASCKMKNLDWSLKCNYCNKYKHVKSEDIWTCSVCSRETEIGVDNCRYCQSKRDFTPSGPSFNKKCIQCGNNIDYVKCYKCRKVENFAVGYCGSCKFDFKSIHECSRCYDRKYKLEELKSYPADPAARSHVGGYGYVTSNNNPPYGSFDRSQDSGSNYLRRSPFNNRH